MTEAATETTQEPVTQDAKPSDSLLESVATMDFSVGKPENFPAEFWNEEAKAPDIDKLFNAHQAEKKRAEGLRAKLSRGEFDGKAPDDVKEYTLELSDELKPLVPDNDPIMETLRLSAKEAGMPKEMFSKLLAPAIAKLAEIKAGIEKEPTEEEIAEARSAEIAKLGEGGHKIIGAVKGFVDQLEAEGLFSKEEALTARSMANNADAVRVFNKLRTLSSIGNNVPLDIPLSQQASRSDIEREVAKALASGNEADYNKYSAMLK